MTKNQTTALIIGLLLISGLLSFAGAIFKIQHWAHGSAILKTGYVFWCLSVGLIIFTAVKRRKKQNNV